MSDKGRKLRKRLEKWAGKLLDDQKDSLLVELVEMGIEQEMISFMAHASSPYWYHTGESIVDGQD